MANAIPPNLTATNTSPVPLGAPVTLTIGAVVPATGYTWTGPNAFSQTGRQISIASVNDTQLGTYTVTIAISGGCSHTATTVLSLANCDLYIQGYDAAGTETFELTRIGAATTTATYQPITLKLLPFEPVAGVENPFAAYNIAWLYNGNLIAGAPNKPEYTATKPGTYTANLSLKLNPATTCMAQAHLNAIPCKTFADQACGTPVTVTLPNTQATGVALAPGDIPTAIVGNGR